MTAAVSNAFSIQIVPSASPYSGWTIGQYQKIFSGTDYNYGNIVGEPYAAILAYSSTAVDTTRSRLILFGGGHGDYGGNEIWTLDLLRPQDKWTQQTPRVLFYQTEETEAFAYADNTDHPGGYVNNTPISRHTFLGNVWVSSQDAMYASGSSTWQGGYTGYISPNDGEADALWNCWPNEAADVWAFYPATNTWGYKGSGLLQSGPDMLPIVPGSLIYSSTRDRIYSLIIKAKPPYYYPDKFGPPDWGHGAYPSFGYLSPFRIWECDPTTNVWTAHANGAPSLTHTLMCVDTALDRIVLIGKPSVSVREVWVYPLGTQVWQKVTTITGTEPPVPPDEEGDRTSFSTLTGRVLYVTKLNKALYALTVNSAGTAASWEQITPTGYFVGMTQAHPGCYDSAHGIHVQPVQNRLHAGGPIDVYAIKA
jgi:hypothetical protein